MDSINSSSTQKRRNVASSPPISKVARSSFSASQIQQSVKDIINSDLNDLINQQLNGILPQMIDSIRAAVLETVERKLDQFLVTLDAKITNNAPPPPPPTFAVSDYNSSSRSPNHKSKAEIDLSNLCYKRTRPYYQQLRHNGLADLFSSSMANEDPVLPRKFAEKVSRFDQAAIVEKKKQMTLQNVMNEIEMLKIYSQNDSEKLAQIDQQAADIIASLPSHEEDQMKIYYANRVKASERKSNEIWGKKLKFLTSDKYLLPLSKLIVLNNDNSNLINSSLNSKSNNYYSQNKQYDNSLNKNNNYNYNRHVSYCDSRNNRTYAESVKYDRERKDINDGNDNFYNDGYFFQNQNQNFRRRQSHRATHY